MQTYRHRMRENRIREIVREEIARAFEDGRLNEALDRVVAAVATEVRTTVNAAPKEDR